MHRIGQMSEQVSNHQRLSSPLSSWVVRNPKKNTLILTIMYILASNFFYKDDKYVCKARNSFCV